MRILRGLDLDWVAYVHDAVAVSRGANGKLRMQDSIRATTAEGVGWGVLLGAILGGLAFAPFTGGLSAAAAAGTVAAGAAGGATLGGLTGAVAATDEKEIYGVSEDFVAQVSATIAPGHSALFALVESHEPERVASYFRGTGGTIIRTTLSPYEQEHYQKILADGRWPY
jgi:uncharacterized membrane protein